MPPSCQRFSSGGSLGKLVLPKALIFLASCDSLSNSVDLFTLNCFVVDPACVCDSFPQAGCEGISHPAGSGGPVDPEGGRHIAQDHL